MAVNWFEGGRRISYLFIGITVTCGAGYVLFGGSEDRLTFETATASDAWHFTTRSCSYPNYEDYRDFSLDVNGVLKKVSLCYRTQDDKLLYQAVQPIRLPVNPHAPKGVKPPVLHSFLTTSPYSEEARVYMADRSRSFIPPVQEMNKARSDFWKIRWKRRWERAKEATPWVMGVIFGISLLTTILGWIIRGFAGIPNGQDFKHAKALGKDG